ncbi:type VI secretion system Vgr family protein [Caballeronia concitans]|uniref:Rhs element Vgr protein n=1 Tax=Caballeronia concitans TaxID=1777133 RepID=A0A658QT88_9BURK|nr:type VI secretion system Vgr family protein [Caballeronia concitans]SAL19647.1 Rhs element Vgr protein [Caballeronia concitans]
MDVQTTRPSVLARWITGRQSYFLKVRGAAPTDGLSIVSVKAIERLGEPYHITLELTANAELALADYLGRSATFSIEPAPDEGTPREFNGVVTRFIRTRKTRDFCAYRIVVESPLARLRITKRSRVYQNKTVPDMIQAILLSHGFLTHQFAFRLRREFPTLAFHMQHQMSDWAFIHLLMRQSGLFCYTRPGDFGDQVIFADDIDGYDYQLRTPVLVRETSGLETGNEAILSLQTHSVAFAQSVRVRNYNPAKSWEPFEAQVNLAHDDKTTYGQTYTWGSHHLDADSAQWEARLRHEEALSGQIRFEGKSTVSAFCTGLVVRTDEKLPDAPHGFMLTEVIHEAARDKSYHNTFRAIPADRPYRIPLREDSWPKISGTLSARVTTRDEDAEFAEMDEHGLYTARFDFDTDEWPSGGESVPLRLAKPFAGAHQTGFHFPLLRNTEVAIAFAGGDPRCPYIAHIHHHAYASDLIHGLDGWNTRNAIRTVSNNKLRLEDAKGKEGAKLATEYGGKTQLNLGYIVDSRRQKRGEGFELRSDSWGALRAGKGLFLSADAQQAASGQTLDMSAALAQLQTAQGRMQSLSEAVSKAKAIVADCEAQKALLETQLKDLQQAVLLASAPHGVALTSGEHMQLSAGGHLFTTTGGNADAAIGGNYTVAAGNAVSIFANAQGVKVTAAEGKVDVQAQGDALNLAALKGVTIASTEDAITLNAKSELTLYCGGSYIKLNSSGVEIGSPSDVRLKGPLRVSGSATKQSALPLMPKQEPTGMQLWHVYPNGEPVKNASYRVDYPDGSFRWGKLDENGKGMLANVPRGGGSIKYFEDGYPIKDDERKWAEPDGAANVQADGSPDAALPSLTGPAVAAAQTAAMTELPALAAPALSVAQAAITGGGGAALKAATQTATQAVIGSMGQQLEQPSTPALAKSLASQ